MAFLKKNNGGYHNYDVYGRPQGGDPYRQPPPDPEYLRRRQAAERKQAEARMQARRDYERRRARQLEYERKRQRKRNAQIFGGRMLVFLVVLVILCIIAGALFLIVFNSTPDAPVDSGKITYFYGGKKTRTADVSSSVRDGSVYFCFNDLADYLEMSESGSAAALKFILHTSNDAPSDSSGVGNEESIAFTTGSCEISVNGQTASLDMPNEIRGSEVWVSSTFVTEYMKNLSLDYNESKGEVRIARMIDAELSTDDAVVYLPVSLKLKSASPLETVGYPEDDATEPAGSDSGTAPTEQDQPDSPDDSLEKTDDTDGAPEFLTDVSAYEEYMNPSDRDGFLRLVNTVNLITESELPTDLVDCKFTAAGRRTQSLRLYAEKALEALMQEMEAAGLYGMAVYSGYRSIAYQTTLFEQYTQNEMAADPTLTREAAEAIVLTYSTRPGTSEHHTGLAVDMDTMGTFSTDFAKTDAYAWLSENAWKFGFVLRFPEDKTEITTIQFEPWHYRFVGRYHARLMHDAGLCLEEYTEQLKTQ